MTALAFAFAGCFDPSHPPGNGADESGSGTDGSASATDSASASASASATASASASASATASATDGSATSASNTSADVTGTDSAETTATQTTNTDATAGDGCDSGQLCVPEVPRGWNGPIVVGDGSCAGAYPSLDAALFAGLVPGVPQCSCSCNIGAVGCQLWLENSDQAFDPAGSCDEPPFEDECISAVVEASCNESFVDVPASPSWETTASACGGASPGAACDGGTCYPDVAPVCVWRDGEQACPAGFDDGTTYFTDLLDSRVCGDCTCTPTGQACELSLEICSVGFFDITLANTDPCFQLNSSDGDSVTLFSAAITAQGSCNANAGGGEITGDVVGTQPVTVCCQP
jgi:hypothetical protein